MSMKRTVPGGRVESVYSRSQSGKEVIATNIAADAEHVEEIIETVEESTVPVAEESTEEQASKEQ